MNKRIKKKLTNQFFDGLADNLFKKLGKDFIKEFVGGKSDQDFVKFILIRQMKSEKSITVRRRGRIFYQNVRDES